MLKKDRQRRKTRIRGKISGVASRPRVSVFKSNYHIYAQLIDDTKGETLAAFSDIALKEKVNKTEAATLVGTELAKKAKEKKITAVVFDRSGYRYHGRVKALAESMRKGGLQF